MRKVFFSSLLLLSYSFHCLPHPLDFIFPLCLRHSFILILDLFITNLSNVREVSLSRNSLFTSSPSTENHKMWSSRKGGAQQIWTKQIFSWMWTPGSSHKPTLSKEHLGIMQCPHQSSFKFSVRLHTEVFNGIKTLKINVLKHLVTYWSCIRI